MRTKCFHAQCAINYLCKSQGENHVLVKGNWSKFAVVNFIWRNSANTNSSTYSKESPCVSEKSRY